MPRSDQRTALTLTDEPCRNVRGVYDRDEPGVSRRERSVGREAGTKQEPRMKPRTRGTRSERRSTRP
jgi:hypothetical protein